MVWAWDLGFGVDGGNLAPHRTPKCNTVTVIPRAYVVVNKPVMLRLEYPDPLREP